MGTVLGPETPKQHVTNFNQLRKANGISVSEYRAAYAIPKTTFYRWRRDFPPASLSATKNNKPSVKPSQKSKPSPKTSKRTNNFL